MQEFKFIHCADLHIDSPFKGLSDVNTPLRYVLYESTFRSFLNIIDLAINERVD
jgi:DNA repair exonuclease SbcCD nuclease subunit